MTMKLKTRCLSLLLILLFTLSLAAPQPVYAQAYSTSFSTAITYQNVGKDIAHVTILVYTEGSSNPITIARPDLPPNASTTVSVGTIGTAPASFKGSAVIRSDVSLAVTLSQIPGNSSMRNRPMASGFVDGSADIWLLPMIKSADTNTLFSIQNIDTAPADLKLTFYGGKSPITITRKNVPAGGSVFYDTANISEIGESLWGNLHIESTRAGGSEPGKVIGMMLDPSKVNTDIAATESLSGGSKKIFLPYAYCNAGGMSTIYYIFNPSLTVTQKVNVAYNSGSSDSTTLAPATGAWFPACAAPHTKNGYNGYAIVTSNPGGVLAVGRIKLKGMSATFLGEYRGYSRLALPYVNWTTANWTNGKRQLTWVTVQNMGASLAAGAVKVNYYDKNGSLVGTHKLAAMPSGSRIDSNAALVGANGKEFGYYADGTTGGSVIVEGPAGSQLMVLGWVNSLDPTTKKQYGEIYNGFPAVLK